MVTKHIPTGGPAFPVECNIQAGIRDDSGMTLRDWFAGHFAPEFIKINERVTQHRDDVTYEMACKVVAMQSYALADAMLSEKYKAEENNIMAEREMRDDLF